MITSTTQPGAAKRPRFSTLFAAVRWIDLLPAIIFGVIVVIVTVAAILLTRSIVTQVNTSTELINLNLSDQARVYVQLQRETLRFIALVQKPADEFDADAVELQYQLLLSRINHLRLRPFQTMLSSESMEFVTQLDEAWKLLEPQVDAWIAAPDDQTARAAVLESLSAFELMANTAEFTQNRVRSQTLFAFAENSRQLPAIFALAGIAIIGLIISALFALYRFLRQTRETAAIREASRVKDQFVAVMSHELRTPLNAIIGFLGIIKMGGSLSDRVLHMVDRSRANAERLLTLIDDILDISKIEAGRFDIHPEVINPRELSQRWTSQTEVLALEKHLQFTATVEPTLPEFIYADPDALTKITTNLLSNAVKFTKQGQINLFLAKQDGKLVIRVIDTGIGIPLEKQSIIFESFRQVDSSTKRAYGGTGLGLFIVKQLTTLLKGTIEVDSKPDAGSTFTVRIPLLPLPVAAPSSAAASAVPNIAAPVVTASPGVSAVASVPLNTPSQPERL